MPVCREKPQNDVLHFQWSTTNVEGVPEFRTIDKFDFEPIRWPNSGRDLRSSLGFTTVLAVLGWKLSNEIAAA